ncbi:MAG: hypothetical protein K1X67_24585 [Fimbriimonadaceae bacterium]|nr:hypothetical protein [Fimbriimonadaceae bacterium]
MIYFVDGTSALQRTFLKKDEGAMLYMWVEGATELPGWEPVDDTVVPDHFRQYAIGNDVDFLRAYKAEEDAIQQSISREAF